MPKKVYFASFGCRTNQADSGALRVEFSSRGYEETANPALADLIVINSCTVTHRSDQQVRQLTRRLRRANPGACLVVTGCYAQRDPEGLARMESVDLVVGNSHKEQLVSLLEQEPEGPTTGELAQIYRDEFSGQRVFHWGGAAPGSRTRPFVKIQDGCDAKCSYCIIPMVRGPSRSLPPERVREQVQDLVRAGFQEIVLTGIHLGTYGLHLRPRYSLDRLLDDLLQIPGLGRLRLSSIEPMQLSLRIIHMAADSEKLAPHFHICLQSGSDRILRRMLRPYNTSRFARIVEEIAKRIPQAGIGTDLIAGFPGEREEDHRQTVAFVSELPFSYFHVFPYSDRRGTRASGMQEKVPPPLVQLRARELRLLSERKNRAFRRSFIGKRLSVVTLSDTEKGARMAVSDNYLKVRVCSPCPPNRILEGPILGEEEGVLLMERPESPPELLRAV